ncbi:MAG TPA: UV DNA damage repair endonuclease UvsE [Bacillota bacterium]|nr:UV DNA damage repair endonuclease UvsE [Bacillota bacterium]
MKVRFGFVAMSMHLEKASPSQTTTVTNFLKIADREAGLRKITNLAHGNLVNTLRILRHALAAGVYVYRFTSKLIPLYGHELTREWDFFPYLAQDFREIGRFVREEGMRVSFHPDHFTLINSPDTGVVQRSIDDLKRHVSILEAMELDDQAKLVIHIGGGYKDKASALERFITNWSELPSEVQARITLENDDKIFTAAETLQVCKQLGMPMVLDIHHHWCNSGGQSIKEMVKPIFTTWQATGLPPKIHVSSPKSEQDKRSHADFICAEALFDFLNLAKDITEALDVMVEAKQKDEALFRLVKELGTFPGITLESPGIVVFDAAKEL